MFIPPLSLSSLRMSVLGRHWVSQCIAALGELSPTHLPLLLACSGHTRHNTILSLRPLSPALALALSPLLAAILSRLSAILRHHSISLTYRLAIRGNLPLPLLSGRRRPVQPCHTPSSPSLPSGNSIPHRVFPWRFLPSRVCPHCVAPVCARRVPPSARHNSRNERPPRAAAAFMALTLSPAVINRNHRPPLSNAALRACPLACGLLLAPAACLQCSMPRPSAASTPPAAFGLHGQRRPSWRSLPPAAIDHRRRLQLFHAALRASLLACGLLLAPAVCLQCSMPRPSAASTPPAAFALHGQRRPSWRSLPPMAIDCRRRL